DGGEYDGRDGAEHEEVAGANVDVALSQHFLQKGDALRAAEKGVESGDAAEDFVAQQSQVRWGFFGGLLNGREAIAENARLSLALIKQRHGGKDRQGDHHKYQEG